jgi:hypothetical protein
MSPVSAPRIGALIAVVASLSVASAGCMVQDRPEHAEFFIVANAGQDQVVPAGGTAHLEWAEEHAVESEGHEAPHVELEYAWHRSEQADPISETTTASVTQSEVGLALVSLEVAVDGVNATDAAAVFFAPPDADTGTHAYIVLLGGIRFWDGHDAPALVHEVEVEGLTAQWAEIALPRAPQEKTGVVLTFSDVDVAIAAEVEGTVMVVVKRGAGPATVEQTGPVTFDASNWYEVVVQRSVAPSQLWITERGRTQSVNASFPAYAADHAAGAESKTLVSEAQSLPGFEGLAAAAALAAGALALARRRR